MMLDNVSLNANPLSSRLVSRHKDYCLQVHMQTSASKHREEVVKIKVLELGFLD